MRRRTRGGRLSTARVFLETWMRIPGLTKLDAKREKTWKKKKKKKEKKMKKKKKKKARQ